MGVEYYFLVFGHPPFHHFIYNGWIRNTTMQILPFSSNSSTQYHTNKNMGFGIAMPMHLKCCCFSNTTMELKWVTKKTLKTKNPISTIPIFISTTPSGINPDALRDLYTSCNHSCYRFPNIGIDGKVERQDLVDVDKLKIALSYSSVVVSVYSKVENFGVENEEKEDNSVMGIGGFVKRIVPNVSPENGDLVGFGRAVSDLGLTASIHDVMVIPSLRGMGIGRMIVRRIVRILTNRDIYDISALCSEDERLFFQACGFGDDILGSTTMMYTRTSSDPSGNQVVKRAGRKLLLVPTPKNFTLS